MVSFSFFFGDLVRIFKNSEFGWAPVAQACNPIYPGGRDQEDCSSKIAKGNSPTRPYLKKPFTKIGLKE
jgi:hypothetical protein